MATDPQLFAVAAQFHQGGAFAQAQRLYRQLLERDADDAELWRRLGEACQALGERREAEAAYRESLRRAPHAGTSNNLGVVLLEPGRLEDAAAAFRDALLLQQDFAEAHNNLGLALAELGRPDEAADHYRQAVRLKPDYAVAHHNLGKALASLGKTPEAEGHFREAIRLRPDYAPAHFHLGNLLRAEARRDEAIDAYREGLQADPRDHRMHNELGVTLLDRARFAEAAACFHEAVRLKPDSAPAYNNLGLALLEQGRHEDARVRLGQSLFLNPDAVEAQYNLGRVLAEQGLHDEALGCFERAVQFKPDAVGALNNLGNAYKDQGRLDEAVARYRQALALDPHNAPVHSNLLFALLYHPGLDPDVVFRAHQEYGRRHPPIAAAPPAPPPDQPLAGRRLRVGYVSPDFRGHIVASYSEQVLAAHDRGRFEVFCYAEVRRPDAVTERIRALAEHWRPLAGLSDAEAAGLIRRDGIDLLIDLAGHSAGNRLPLFALRPAPVQATHFGYPATTGLDAVDYRITDAHCDPPGRTDRWYTEELVRLPGVQWCYRAGTALAVGPLPASSAGHVTFGCFNNLAKVTDEVLALWSRILAALPDARMRLTTAAGAAGDRRVLDAFARHGIDPGRVTPVPRRPTEEYFRLYQGVDVCLDPFPFTGCFTTADALWMGAPVVTLAGPTCVSRQGLSALRLVGLEELIAETADAYVGAAIRLGRDLPRLSACRSGLRERLRQSPLMDPAGFTRRLEAAYIDMWERRMGRTARGARRRAAGATDPALVTGLEG